MTYLYSVRRAVAASLPSGVRITGLNALRLERDAMAVRRRLIASSNFAFEGDSSTRFHSAARFPRTRPPATVEEGVGEVARIFRLSIDEARRAPGPREHAEERRLRKTDGAVAVVHEDDLVAGDGELVAAPGSRPAQRRERADAPSPRSSPRARGGSRSCTCRSSPSRRGSIARACRCSRRSRRSCPSRS